MRPTPGMTICDPACGTGGLFLASYERLTKTPNLDPDQKRSLRFDTFRGWEIVDNTARLCDMNLLLHGIGAADAASRSRWTMRCAPIPATASTWC